MLVQKDISNRLNEVFEARVGRILEIKQEHSKKSQDKRLWARIEVFPSGTYDDVPFWGGGFDFDTEMPHGIFDIPRKNQYIIIIFINADFSNPIGCFPIPFPYDYSFVENYYDLVESVNDLSIFHFSGSRVILREDGTIDIQKRIEESTDNFVNHTLKIKFEYDEINDIRKKTITDIDNDVIIELTTDDVKITDPKDQVFNMHFKDNEEKVEVIDKSGQKLLLDSTNGSENVELKKSTNQKINMTSTKTAITAPLLDLLAGTESFIKGDTWKAGFQAFLLALSVLSGGTTAQNAAAINTIATAANTLNGLLTNMLSSKIKGE